MAPLRRRRRRGWRCSASGSGLAGSVESESGSAGAGAERPLAAEIFFWRAKICIEIGGKTTTRIFHVKVDMYDKESSHDLPPNLCQCSFPAKSVPRVRAHSSQCSFPAKSMPRGHV